MCLEAVAVSNYIVHRIKEKQKDISFADTIMYNHIYIIERRLHKRKKQLLF